jgi:predicted dehydrogenase
MDQYGVAIIGLGVIGRRMIGNMGAHERFGISGAWDIDQAARASAARDFDGLPIADGAEAMIRADDTDLVYIGVPPLHHGDYVMAALDAGKAVLCEKPLGIDVAASRALVERVEASGRPSALNFVYGSTAASETVGAALADGALGAVAGVDVRLHFSAWPRAWQASAAWLSHREQGGYVREVLSHFIYLAQRLLGPLALQAGSVCYPDAAGAAESHVVARLDAGGVPVTVAGSSGGIGPDRVEFTVWGERASYRLTDWYKLSRSDGGPWTDQLGHIENLGQDAYSRQLGHLATMLDGAPHTMPSFRDGLAVQEIIEDLLTRA